jgi:hypothetical protein
MSRFQPRRPRRLAASTFVAWAALLLLNGCAAKTVTIKSLLDDPSQYDGDDVRIVGDVEEGSAGALGVGTYEMNDGTGTLRVVTKSGGAPRAGAHVGVEGTFRSAFTLGVDSFAVLQEKNRFTP